MSVGIYENGQYNKCAGNAKESSATNTTYINTISGLQATNVQGAIDELNNTLRNNTFTTITFSDNDLQCPYGGFVKIGNIVIVNATLAFKNSKTKFSGITSNMPIPKHDINLLLSNWNDDQHTSHYFGMEGNTEPGGNIYTNIPAATNKSLVLTGCYICR